MWYLQVSQLTWLFQYMQYEAIIWKIPTHTLAALFWFWLQDTFLKELMK